MHKVFCIKVVRWSYSFKYCMLIICLFVYTNYIFLKIKLNANIYKFIAVDKFCFFVYTKILKTQPEL